MDFKDGFRLPEGMNTTRAKGDRAGGPLVELQVWVVRDFCGFGLSWVDRYFAGLDWVPPLERVTQTTRWG